MCGEQSDATPAARCRIGSPPRVRGAECEYLCRVAYIRITPACAGSSAHLRAGRSRPWDHPRVCGEQNVLRFVFARAGGSPPRVRGAASLFITATLGARITPACAGSSGGTAGRTAWLTDHPRVCGEQCLGNQLRGSAWGSPPRVRGAVDGTGGRFNAVGITPACAGSSIAVHNCDAWR